MAAAIQVPVHAALVAHRERGRPLPEVLDLEAHRAPGVHERRRFANQAFTVSHWRSSGTPVMQAFGAWQRNAASGCAPYVTASASTPAFFAICKSCEVSPTISNSPAGRPK